MANVSITPSRPAFEFTHAGLARRYKFVILITLTLVLLENIFVVLRPYYLGAAIDSLLNNSIGGLMTFMFVAFSGLTFAVGRRYYDTRAYGGIYKTIAHEVVDKERTENASSARVTARANFVNEFTEFFENGVPAACMSVISLIGTIVMLGFISFRLFLAALVCTMAIGAVFYFSRKRINAYNSDINGEMEHQVDRLSAEDPAVRRGHFETIVGARIKLSDLEAKNVGIVGFLTILLIGFTAYVLILWEGKSEGDVVAALTYITQLSRSYIFLPFTYQQFLRTLEISNRIIAKA